MKSNGRSATETTSAGGDAITRITVRGYKSLQEELSIEIRPLTVLAGANSSGKSSVMQPLLLMKQTLESTFDPGALLLDGPNLRFTSAEQLFSRHGARHHAKEFCAGFSVGELFSIASRFDRRKAGIELCATDFVVQGSSIELRKGMSGEEIDRAITAKPVALMVPPEQPKEVLRDRCFLTVGPAVPGGESVPGLWFLKYDSHQRARAINFLNYVNNVIHLPGLRGNPERNYPVTAVRGRFPGTFEKYTASVIENWQQGKRRSEEIEKLNTHLRLLGLTWKVTANRINDTQVELLVGRLPVPSQGGAHDLVSIADVGFGVSQSLPVLVALLAARPGQLVYLEQPEIHLHPRAQTALAQVLADAAKRGVRVVVETHSDLVLLGIQTQVASGALPADIVKLHWFERQKDGSTSVTSADLDENGTFGDWPEDFADVRLKAESQFLDASLGAEAG